MVVLSLTEQSTGIIAFSLEENSDACNGDASCLTIYEDSPSNGGPAATEFRVAMGTLDLGQTQPPYIAGTLHQLKLVEVTVDELLHVTEVPDGRCLYIQNIAVQIPPPAPGWTCDWYADSICQCGCGAPDPDCPNATMDDCQICDDIGSCNVGQCPGTIDPNDTTSCQ